MPFLLRPHGSDGVFLPAANLQSGVTSSQRKGMESVSPKDSKDPLRQHAKETN
jgi:hypothetical protein